MWSKVKCQIRAHLSWYTEKVTDRHKLKPQTSSSSSSSSSSCQLIHRIRNSHRPRYRYFQTKQTKKLPLGQILGSHHPSEEKEKENKWAENINCTNRNATVPQSVSESSNTRWQWELNPKRKAPVQLSHDSRERSCCVISRFGNVRSDLCVVCVSRRCVRRRRRIGFDSPALHVRN